MFVPAQRPEFDCGQCDGLLPRYLSAQLDAPRIALVRRHLGECETCREGYRSSAEALAAMGAQHREERLEVERQTVALRQKREAEDGGQAVRRSRLRSLVWPALVALLLVLLSIRDLPGSPRLHAVAGAVQIDSFRLTPGAAPGELVPGRACLTGADGYAEIRTAKSGAELSPLTVVSYQGSRPLRLRLDEGQLAVEGPSRVLFAGGLLELEEGRARVAIAPDGIRMECLEGSAMLLSSDGSQRLEAGKATVLPFAVELPRAK